MGRGRAKAKQTKVARELKYGGPQTDLSRLQQELASEGVPSHEIVEVVEETADDPYAVDPYAKYYDGDDEDEAAAR
jgi:hypothetical protein